MFKADLKTYAGFGIRNVISFAVYMGDQYWKQYPDQSFLKEYGEEMNL